MYYTDKPIFSSEEDKLERGSFAKLLAQSLINLNNLDTFAVGLFGRWGSGKTSLVNMVLREIEESQRDCDVEKKIIIVRFEPWNFSNTDQLLTQFFVRLSNEFKSKGDKRFEKIGDALESYSNAFEIAETIPYFGSVLSKLGKNGLSRLGKKLKKGSDEKDVLKQKEYVINLLEKQANRILIVIDDIDRLSDEQIRHVFQLITSVAKFPNTTYLLVFDKDIIIKALKNVQEGSGEEYLEKIIQMPIQIPDIQKGELRKVLFERLDRILKEHEDIFFSEQHWQKIYTACIDPFIKSIRDINRLCNSVRFKLTTIASEVDFADMVAISVLELYFPTIFEWVKNNKNVLVGDPDNHSMLIMNMSQNERKELYQKKIQNLLKTNDTDEVSGEDVELVLTFLSHIFPYFSTKIGKLYEVSNNSLLRKNNHIGHSEKFDRYFNLNLDCINIKKSTIVETVYSLDEAQIIECLLEHERNGSTYEFLEEIRSMIPDIPEERARIIIKCLIDTANKLDSRSQKDFLQLKAGSYAVYLVNDLIEKIPSEERLNFLSKMICSSNTESLSCLANTINLIELSYGRLAANGKRRNYNEVITLDELCELEKVFCEKVKEILNTNNIFDFNEWNMIYYLMENFDSEYTDSYMRKILRCDVNVLHYLVDCVLVWTGAGIKYEIKDEYTKYLTKERILQAIYSKKESGELFSLSKTTQNKVAAFYLHSVDNYNEIEGIKQADVDKILAEWREN